MSSSPVADENVGSGLENTSGGGKRGEQSGHGRDALNCWSGGGLFYSGAEGASGFFCRYSFVLRIIAALKRAGTQCTKQKAPG